MKASFSTIVLGALLLIAAPFALAQTTAPENLDDPFAVLDLFTGQEARTISGPPSVFATNISITTQTAESATGTFTIENRDETAVGDVYYELQLLSPRETLPVGEVVTDTAITFDIEVHEERLSLASNETRRIGFEYDLPTLPLGEYRLRVQLKTGQGLPLGWNDATLTAGTEGISFIAVTGASLGVTSTDPATNETKDFWQPLEGPNVAPGQAVNLLALANALPTGPLEATPVLTFKRLLDEESSQSTQKLAAVTINSDEELTLPITAPTEPGSYDVNLSFEVNGQAASSVTQYRLVVEGTSASLSTVKVVDLPTTSGSSATVDFVVVGSADRVSAFDGTVTVEILDDEQAVAEQSNTVALSFETGQGALAEGTATLALSQNICGTPGVRVTLADTAGKVHDTHLASFDELATGCGTAADSDDEEDNDVSEYLLWGGLGVAALLLIGLIIWLIQKRRKPPVIGSPDQPAPDVSAPPTTPTTMLILLAIAVSALAISAGFSKTSEANGINLKIGGLETPNPRANNDAWTFVNLPIHDSTQDSRTVIYERQSYIQYCTNAAGRRDGQHLLYLPGGGKVASEDAVERSAWKSVPYSRTEYRSQLLGRSSGFPIWGIWWTDVASIELDEGVDNTTFWSLVYVVTNWHGNSLFHNFTWTNIGSAQCSDELDNDGDGAVDCADPGCLDAAGQCDPTDTNENEPPFAGILVDSEVPVSTAVTLSGAPSNDPDGEIVSYEWTITDPDGNTTTATGPITTFTPPTLGDWTITLVVTDDDGAKSTAGPVTVKVVETPLDAKFTITGGILNQPVNLDASTSTPTTGPSAITNYRWTVTHPTAGNVLSTDTSQPTAAFTPTVTGTYTIHLSVINALGDEAGETKQLSVADGVGGLPISPIREVE